MTPAASSPISVRFTPEFKRNLHTLAKKYRHIRADVQPVIEQLQAGNLPGARVPGVGVPIFKVRVRNRDAVKGKSGGYRLLYYLQTTTEVILVTLYSKSEQSDISAADIHDILRQYNHET